MIRKAFMLGVVIAALAAGGGAGELFIPADGSVVTTDPLTAGQSYIIEARGTYGYKNTAPEKTADAEWVYSPLDETWVETPAGGDLDLYVDGADISMMGKVGGSFSRHVFSPEHIYRANVLGGGEPIELSIYDKRYDDNSGGLHVTISLGWQGVTIVPQMGDTNVDGVIDGRDYENLVVQFGGPPGDESADFNGDGIVDLHDFAIQRESFGLGVASAPAGESRAMTPEPATLVLLAFGGMAVVGPRRSKGGDRK